MIFQAFYRERTRFESPALTFPQEDPRALSLMGAPDLSRPGESGGASEVAQPLAIVELLSSLQGEQHCVGGWTGSGPVGLLRMEGRVGAPRLV